MPITVVLAVGLDAWQLTAQSPALSSAGYVVISAVSCREAIGHFRAGDFDLVMLGHSISMEDKERLTFPSFEHPGQEPPWSALQNLPATATGLPMRHSRAMQARSSKA